MDLRLSETGEASYQTMEGMNSPEKEHECARLRVSSCRRTTMMVGVYATAACLCIASSCVGAFSPSNHVVSRAGVLSDQRNNIVQTRVVPRHSTQLYNLFPKDDLFPKTDFDRDPFLDEDDGLEGFDPAMAAQIRKARQLLNDSKRKQREQEEAVAKAAESGEESAKSLPFFAAKSLTSSASQNAQKIKSKNESGEIIADGETMASLSKSEPWERRSLSQMFDKEKGEDYDGNEVDPDLQRALAERDIASSIYNMRKYLQNEDFRKVFDSRNRFIGDVE